MPFGIVLVRVRVRIVLVLVRVELAKVVGNAEVEHASWETPTTHLACMCVCVLLSNPRSRVACCFVFLVVQIAVAA